ncbi:MAG: ModE family transcriptional regulator [Betaproteobacteria bacterium RBG_16_58_11]|nr:MAG: ModE family transcriptional regulator [Betaproteobacteria bacterium RBG_16_58_11]
MVKPSIRILFGAASSLGPGKIALLESISRAGSISGAAREMGMSYRRAWLLVEAMNKAFKKPLVMAVTGGKRGGGAEVTAFGHALLLRYREIEAKAAAAVAADLKALAKMLAQRE